MNQYRKLVVALVGAGVMIGSEVFGWKHLVGMEDAIVTSIVTLLTAVGVWMVPNAPSPTADVDAAAKQAAKEVLERLRSDKRR